MGVTHLSGLEVAGVPTMGMSGIPATNGNVYFVNSVSGSDGNPGTADFPYATIAAAYSVATADSGDIIVCTAGHAETISAAGGLTLSKSGIVIWGLGEGAERPTLTFGTSTAATVLITGASTQIYNFVGVCNIDQLVSPFVVQAADVTLDIEWHDGAANKEALRAVLTSAAADRFSLTLKYIGFTAGSNVVNAVRLVGADTANIIIDFYGKVTTAVVEFLTTACVNVNVEGYFYVSGTTNLSKNVVDTVTGSTWSVQGFDGAAGQSFSGGSGSAVAADDVSTVIANQAVPTADATANALERDVIGNKTDASVTTVGTTKSLMAYLKGAINWLTVPSADATANASTADVVGNKTDAAVTTVGTTKSIIAYAKGILAWIGTITNSGGTATIGAVLGDFANTTLIAKLNVPTADATANVSVTEVVGNKTDAAVTSIGADKSIVGYIKGVLTWIGTITNTAGTATIGAVLGDFANTTLISKLNVPTADATVNVSVTEVVGNKTDAAVTAVGTQKSVTAYAKGLVTMNTVQSADSTANAFAGDVVGNKTDASIYVPGTTKSLAAYAKGTADLQERVAAKGAAVMVNADTLFTVAGGPIAVEALWSECVTGNDATASTIQYQATPTSGSAQTISAASASIANAAAGASISLIGTTLATAALYNANGPNLGMSPPGGIIVPVGTINIVVGAGSTTGTWRHYIRYRPLAAGVTVS
jgi:hypothetical protein